jgi:hypothetical protein
LKHSHRWAAVALPGVLALTVGLGVTPTAHTTAQAVAPPAPHIMVIIDENAAYDSSLGSPYIVGNTKDAPYINNTLIPTYTNATNWFSVEHVSDYDYFDLVSGANQKGLTKPVSGTSFVDQLAAKGISWKAYMEGMPSTCYTGGQTGNYVKGHNPFVQFKSIVNNPSQCKNDVPYSQSQMTSDLNATSPPSFVWVTPDECNDMHTKCGLTNNLVRQGDNWLSTNIPAIQSTSWYKSGGTIIVTWDESVVPDTSGAPGTTDSGGHVPTVVISAGNHSTFSNAGDHFGTLHGLENAYGVTCLVAACNAVHGDISGAFHATTGAITGTVTDSQNNAAISGATVTCTCSGTAATTDLQGLYNFSAIAPGNYTLSFSATGYTPQNGVPVSVSKGSTTTKDAVLVSQTGSIMGHVTDSQTTNPISGATVSCPTCPTTTATTDTNGKYTFSTVPQGSYSLSFSATGYTGQPDVPVSVTNGSATTRDEALAPQPGSITGTVTDASTQAAIVGATVTCPTCPISTATTDGSGKYSFSSVPEGGYSLSFSANGYASQNSVAVTVVPGAATTQDQALSATTPFIFGDGFESGDFSAWTSSSGLTVQSTTFHAGSFAAQGIISSAAGDARKTLPSTYNTAYERVWFRLASQSTQVYLLQANTAANSAIAIVYSNSSGLLGLQAADGSRHDSTTAVTANAWHELEVRVTVSGTTSSADVWLDNMSTPVLSLTNINLKTTAVGAMQVGDATSHTWNAVFDDAAFDINPIP